MEAINWALFFGMLPFCAYGFLIHLVTKIVLAKKVKGFTLVEFIKRQALGWVLAWLLITLAAYISVRGYNIFTKPAPPDILGLFIGLGCGSLGKNISKSINLFNPLKK